jgi:hypothetical protein
MYLVVFCQFVTSFLFIYIDMWTCTYNRKLMLKMGLTKEPIA